MLIIKDSTGGWARKGLDVGEATEIEILVSFANGSALFAKHHHANEGLA